MGRQSQLRRVTVELIVRAESQEEAREHTIARMNDWFTSGELIPDTAGFPPGTLLFFHVTPASGHRAVAA